MEVYDRYSCFFQRGNLVKSLWYSPRVWYFGNVVRLWIIAKCWYGTFTLLQLFYAFYFLLRSKATVVEAEIVAQKDTFKEILNSTAYCLIYFTELYTIAYISNAVIVESEKLSMCIHNSFFIKADKRFIQSVRYEWILSFEI